MIRINLAAPRIRPRVKRPVAIGGTLQLVFLLLALGAGLVVLAGHYIIIQNEIRQRERDIQEKEAERRQMAQLEKEIRDFEAKQRLLRGRIDVIEQLKRNQAGPVRLLDTIGTTVSLTDTLWLTSVEDKGGDQIEFKGMAGSVEAVANFITNLNRSGFFQNVDIKESVQRAEGEGPAEFEFTLTGKFTLPALPAPGPEAATPATGQT